MTGAVWQISAQKPVYKKKKKKFYKCQEKILDSNAPFVYDSQGDVMESIVKQSLLYDFYGELLTEHQRSIYEDVVYNDMSLSEIAEENGISYAQLKGANLWLRDSKLLNKAGKTYSIIIPRAGR